MRALKKLGTKLKWEVIIEDQFTGETIVIDNHRMSKKPLSIKEYHEIDSLREMILSKKPLYMFSIQ